MNNVKNIFLGIGVAFLTTVITLIIVALLLSFSDVNESIEEPAIMIISALSGLLGGFMASRKIHKNGILNGGIIGISYFLILYLISSILNWNFVLSVKSIVMILVGVACAIAGGILGVNIQKKPNP